MTPFWNDEFWRRMNAEMNDMNKIMRHFIADGRVKDKLQHSNKIYATIKVDGKTYKISMEEVIPVDEEIKIEFEEAPPDRHPDFTE